MATPTKIASRPTDSVPSIAPSDGQGPCPTASPRAELAFFDSPLLDWHEGHADHPERPERLVSIRRRLATSALASRLERPEFGPVEDRILSTVHSEKYLAALARLALFGGGYISADTYVTGESFEVARLAAGAAEAAVLGVLEGKFRRAFCSVRPAGHHAGRESALGFCLLNNIVVGACTALQHPTVRRVAILDWDAHHGNGTEELTYDRDDIYYVSVHQHPAFPFTGEPNSRGAAKGTNLNLNIALPPGAGDAEVLSSWDRIILPEWKRYRPDIVLISAGFDGDARDPLAELTMTTSGYHELTTRVVDFADEFCSGRVVSVLEGGYDIEALAEDVCAHLEALL